MAKDQIPEVNHSWNDMINFRFSNSTEDENLILDFVNQHFVPNEPLNVSISICEPGYRMLWFDNFIRKYISEGLTLMAFESKTNELVGIAVCTECKRSPEPSESSESSEGWENSEIPRWAVMPVKFGQILDFLEHLISSVDIFEDFNLDRYLELFILCTHSTKRHPGLGKELVVRSMHKAASMGFQLYVTEATSFYSQKIFDKLGFSVLKEIAFEDYRPHGKVIFSKVGMHDCVKLSFKRLQN